MWNPAKRRDRTFKAWLLIGAALLAGMAGAQTRSAPPEAKSFFRLPDLERGALSPSGRWLAMVSGLSSARSRLVVFDLQQWGQVTQAAGFEEADVGEFEWVNDDRLVFNLTDRDSGVGERRFAPGLFSVRRDGSDLQTLVESVVTGGGIVRRTLDRNHVLLHVPAGGGDDVIVGELKFDNTGDLQAVFAKRLNVVTRDVTSLSRGAPANTKDWLFDAQGVPRLTTTVHRGRMAVYWRASDGGGWQQLAEFDALAPGFVPNSVDAAGQLYVTVSEGPARTAVLKRFDFGERRPEREAIVSTPGFDFTGRLVVESSGGRVLGVRATTDAETTVWFDDRLKALQQEADRRLPGRINRVSCRRCDTANMTALVYSWSDRDPGQYWVYFAEGQAWRQVGRVRDDIEPRHMAPLDFHRIRARDGRDLPVWITTPNGPAARRPAVVLVHGGPWVRGTTWRWNPMAQFLASRGYLVIEPEFRGSSGYGQAHFRAGIKQWGRAMQDDVADAALWAAREGLIDPKRVCIAGASYGGYSTLMGLVRHPELYRCGAAWVAVTDPRLMFKSSWENDISEEGRRYSLPMLMGDPVADAEMLAGVAPVELAGRIKAPLLLAYGQSDRRVPLDHGTRMRAAMHANGQSPEWVVYDGEGHQWMKLETRLDFARRLENFLARHLR